MGRLNTIGIIDAHMTILDIVSSHRQTQAVFERYNETAGECICCQSLFETLEAVAEKYKLNIKEMIDDLNRAVLHEEGADQN